MKHVKSKDRKTAMRRFHKTFYKRLKTSLEKTGETRKNNGQLNHHVTSLKDVFLFDFVTFKKLLKNDFSLAGLLVKINPSKST